MPRRMTVTLRDEALYTAVRAEAARRHRSMSEWMQDRNGQDSGHLAPLYHSHIKS